MHRHSLTRRSALCSLAAAAAISLAPRAFVRAQDATPEPLAPPQTLLPVQPEGQKGEVVPINGADIYYEEYGKPDGQAVLLLHGGLGNGD
ncbi:MAG: hypothetical protein ACR2J8_06830, partial [Thermomicrobiales bacterium]